MKNMILSALSVLLFAGSVQAQSIPAGMYYGNDAIDAAMAEDQSDVGASEASHLNITSSSPNSLKFKMRLMFGRNRASCSGEGTATFDAIDQVYVYSAKASPRAPTCFIYFGRSGDQIFVRSSQEGCSHLCGNAEIEMQFKVQ